MALRKVGGLWLKDGAKGKFFSGEVKEALPAGTRILIFKNNRKQPGEKFPDYEINVTEDDGEQAPPRQSPPADEPSPF
jgi:hypothetical protein